jgi:hypothetical protein
MSPERVGVADQLPRLREWWSCFVAPFALTQGETHGADRHDCISRSSRPDSYYCYIDREEEGDRFELRRESLDRGGRHFVSFFFFVFQAAFLISVHFENLSKCFVRFRVFF